MSGISNANSAMSGSSSDLLCGLTGKYEDRKRQNLAKQTSAKEKEIGIIEATQYYLAN